MKKTMIFIFFVGFFIFGFTANAKDLIDEILETEVIEVGQDVGEKVNKLGHTVLFVSANKDLDEYITKEVKDSEYAVAYEQLKNMWKVWEQNLETMDENVFQEELDEVNYGMGNYLSHIVNLELKKRQMGLKSYIFLCEKIDLKTLEEKAYFEPVDIVNSEYTTKEIVNIGGKEGTVLRLRYNSPDKDMTIDVPCIIKNKEVLEVDSDGIRISLGAENEEKIDIWDDKFIKYFLIVSALEDMYRCKSNIKDFEENPPTAVKMESLPRVTDQEVLNQDVDFCEYVTYKEELKHLMGDDRWDIFYSSYKKTEEGGKDYAYSVWFFNNIFGDYRFACRRDGIIEFQDFQGTGRFTYYFIPDLSQPNLIIAYHYGRSKSGEEILTANNIEEHDIEFMETINEFIKLLKEFPKETGINIGI